MMNNEKILISACLLGINCRWDGESRPCKKVIDLFKEGKAIPIRPEQLGGLPTPRIPSEQVGDKVISKSGKDVTENFVKGANEVLKIAKLLKIKKAVLKSKSPSCGCGKIFDGTFSGKLINGDGITTTLLKKNGIKIVNEEVA